MQCLDISKVLVVPPLLLPPISVQGSAAIPSYLTRELLRGLLDTYWIPETKESFFDLIYPRAWNALEMWTLLTGGRRAATTLLNLYCLGLGMLLIMFAGCPITLGSKLQTEIALSTTESEYIALSTAMREVIPFLGLMQEIGDIFGLLAKKPEFKCTVWEDNNSCITIDKSPK